MLTNEQKAAIAETKSALECLEALLSVTRELGAPLTQESIEALGIAMSHEMQRIVQVAHLLPSRDAQVAA